MPSTNGINYTVNASGLYGGQTNNAGQDLTKATSENPGGRFDYVPPTTTAGGGGASGPAYSAAVVTSDAAKNNYAATQTAYNDIKTGMANQATANAQAQAVTTATTQANTTQANADKTAADKAAADKMNAQAKLAAINGPIASPKLGDTVTDTQGRPGVSAFDANTGAPQTKPASAATQATATDTGLSNENASYQANIANSLNQQAAAYADYKSQVQQLRNGTFPLSNAQQALIDSTAQSFDTAIKEANLRGAAASSQTGGFSNKVGQALGEISNIDSQKAGAIAKLEIGFQEEDYKMITDAYSAFTDAEKTKTELLTKLHENVVKEADDLRKANADAAKAYYEQVTKPINEIAMDAAKNGADASTVAAIGKAKDLPSAVEAAGSSLQTGSGAVGEYLFYKREAEAKGLAPMSFNDYQTMDANRKRPITNIVNGMSNQQFGRLNTIADNARQDPNIKDFPPVRASFETAKSAAAKKDGTGDVVLMRMLAKITDPTTGVREEEFKTFQDAQSTLANYGVKLTKQMWSGDRLTDNGRNALLDAATDIYDQRKSAYDNSFNFFSGQAAKVGGGAEDVMPYYVAPSDGENSVAGNQQQVETQLKSALSVTKASNPDLYKTVSKLWTSVNPTTGKPYTAFEVNDIFPDLATYNNKPALATKK